MRIVFIATIVPGPPRLDSKKQPVTVKSDSDPTLINRVNVMLPQSPIQDYKFLDEKFSKSATKLENTVKELQMKNILSKTPPVTNALNSTIPSSRANTFTKSKSVTDILNIPAQLQASGVNSKKFHDSPPIVTVTVRTKAGEKDQHVIKRPKVEVFRLFLSRNVWLKNAQCSYYLFDSI